MKAGKNPTWTNKQLNLSRDMYGMVRKGQSIDDAEKQIVASGWRCDDGKLPNTGDFRKVKARLRLVQARRQASKQGILR